MPETRLTAISRTVTSDMVDYSLGENWSGYSLHALGRERWIYHVRTGRLERMGRSTCSGVNRLRGSCEVSAGRGDLPAWSSKTDCDGWRIREFGIHSRHGQEVWNAGNQHRSLPPGIEWFGRTCTSDNHQRNCKVQSGRHVDTIRIIPTGNWLDSLSRTCTLGRSNYNSSNNWVFRLRTDLRTRMPSSGATCDRILEFDRMGRCHVSRRFNCCKDAPAGRTSNNGGHFCKEPTPIPDTE